MHKLLFWSLAMKLFAWIFIQIILMMTDPQFLRKCHSFVKYNFLKENKSEKEI